MVEMMDEDRKEYNMAFPKKLLLGVEQLLPTSLKVRGMQMGEAIQ